MEGNETMAETEPDQRLTQRVDHLYATDPQFRAAAPLQEVTDAAHGAGLRLWEVVEQYLNGYTDRPALGQRAREVTRDETTGRTTTTHRRIVGGRFRCEDGTVLYCTLCATLRPAPKM